MAPEPKTALEQLSDDYWQARMEQDPMFATALGNRSMDDRLPDVTPEGTSRSDERFASILRRCEAIDEAGLDQQGKLTLSALRTQSRAQLDYSSCHVEEWTVDPLNGPQVELLNLESYQPVSSPQEGKAMVKRWNAIGAYLDDHILNLRRGMAGGKVAARAGTEKTIDEIEGLLGKPQAEWAFLRPLLASHAEWAEQDRKEFDSGLRKAVEVSVGPGYERYLRFLRSEVLPQARPQELPGICHIPGGLDSYSSLIRIHTSLNLTAEELHSTGMREVGRINSEMEALGAKVFGTKDRKQTLRRLRTDPDLYFKTRDEVFEKAEKALARARATIPKWFGRLPKAECEVVRMEEHEEKHSTIAYYRQPAVDGTRSGRYYINTFAPETRPRYEAEALAYHESIPGHHLQIAIAQELEGIPEFRKHTGVTAFIEGWGLYTERLSDEMGMYSSDLDKIGVLSYDSWRACRLVVDTGMHAKGWTRQQAIDFMLENSALAENNIVNEVDRYIAWPGQALAYKTGQLEIVRLREEAKKRQGSGFNIREFHDAVLSNGAISLGDLRAVVERQLAA